MHLGGGKSACRCWTETGRLGVRANTRGPGKNSRKAGPHWNPEDPQMWPRRSGLGAPRACAGARSEGVFCKSLLPFPPQPQFTDAPGPCMRGWALPLQAPPQWSETQRGGTDCAQGPLNAVPTWAHREANPGPAPAATCSGPAPVKPRLHTAGPAPRGPWRAAGVPLYSLNPACQPSSEKPRPRMSPPLNYQWGGGTDRGTAKCRTPPPRPSCSPSSLGTPFLSFCPADTLASTCRLTPGLISILASDLLLLPSPQSTQTHKRVLPLEFSWLCFQVPQTQLPTGRPSHPPHSPQLPQPPTLFPRSAALPCSLVLPSRLPGCPARRPLRGYTRDPSLGAEPKPRWRAFPVIRPFSPTLSAFPGQPP